MSEFSDVEGMPSSSTTTKTLIPQNDQTIILNSASNSESDEEFTTGDSIASYSKKKRTTVRSNNRFCRGSLSSPSPRTAMTISTTFGNDQLPEEIKTSTRRIYNTTNISSPNRFIIESRKLRNADKLHKFAEGILFSETALASYSEPNTKMSQILTEPDTTKNDCLHPIIYYVSKRIKKDIEEPGLLSVAYVESLYLESFEKFSLKRFKKVEDMSKFDSSYLSEDELTPSEKSLRSLLYRANHRRNVTFEYVKIGQPKMVDQPVNALVWVTSQMVQKYSSLVEELSTRIPVPQLVNPDNIQQYLADLVDVLTDKLGSLSPVIKMLACISPLFLWTVFGLSFVNCDPINREPTRGENNHYFNLAIAALLADRASDDLIKDLREDKLLKNLSIPIPLPILSIISNRYELNKDTIKSSKIDCAKVCTQLVNFIESQSKQKTSENKTPPTGCSENKRKRSNSREQMNKRRNKGHSRSSPPAGYNSSSSDESDTDRPKTPGCEPERSVEDKMGELHRERSDKSHSKSRDLEPRHRSRSRSHGRNDKGSNK